MIEYKYLRITYKTNIAEIYISPYIGLFILLLINLFAKLYWEMLQKEAAYDKRAG